MRTTLNVDDDVLDAAKNIAQFQKMSVGEALSSLARKGMNAPFSTVRDPVSGLLVLQSSGPKFGLEEVQKALDEEDLDYARKFFHK